MTLGSGADKVRALSPYARDRGQLLTGNQLASFQDWNKLARLNLLLPESLDEPFKRQRVRRLPARLGELVPAVHLVEDWQVVGKLLDEDNVIKAEPGLMLPSGPHKPVVGGAALLDT